MLSQFPNILKSMLQFASYSDYTNSFTSVLPKILIASLSLLEEVTCSCFPTFLIPYNLFSLYLDTLIRQKFIIP